MDDDGFLALERRLWLEGAVAWDALLDEAALMAFPQMGVMGAEVIRESLRQAPRWDAVTFAEARVGRPDGETAVLGYTAQATRAGADPYRCVCTSTYRRSDETWHIVQHQQSPLG